MLYNNEYKEKPTFLHSKELMGTVSREEMAVKWERKKNSPERKCIIAENILLIRLKAERL